MNNKSPGFDEYNYERKKEKIRLYSSILAVLKTPMTIEQLSEAHQCSRKPSFYHNILLNMQRNGYVEKLGKAEKGRWIYHALKPKYEEDIGVRPKVYTPKFDDRINGARVIKLEDYQDRYEATQRMRNAERKTGKVYIASTFNMV